MLVINVDCGLVALLGDEAATGEVVDERLVDRRALELEVVEVLGERQLGINPKNFRVMT